MSVPHWSKESWGLRIVREERKSDLLSQAFAGGAWLDGLTLFWNGGLTVSSKSCNLTKLVAFVNHSGQAFKVV